MSGPTTRRRSTCSTRQDRRCGPGHPDIGLFGAKQLQNGKLKQGQTPEAGVVEVKPARDDAWLTAGSDRVSGYWGLYRVVLVTNTRDFVLPGEDGQGNPAKLKTFRLAGSAAGFESEPQHPRAFANAAGPALSEYLGRCSPGVKPWKRSVSGHSGRREHGNDRPDRADLPGRARAAGVGR